MSLFHHKLAHQLVPTHDKWNRPVYQCSVCTRVFHQASNVSKGKEHCCGKRCYVEHTFDDIPAYLMPEREIKALGYKLRKHQEALAYKHYELIGVLYGPRPVEYTPLYDIRECIALDGAVPLPELA